MWNTLDAIVVAMMTPRMTSHLMVTNTLSRIINAASSGLPSNSLSSAGNLFLELITVPLIPHSNLPKSSCLAGTPVSRGFDFLQFV